MPVLLPEGCDRSQVMQRMREQNIQTSMHYPPIHTFSYYRRAVPTPPLPQTERFCERQLTLPLHPKLSMEDVDRVALALRDALLA
jgi:dTDP-4-amino-4,6-dideoxygalactose transaminase